MEASSFEFVHCSTDAVVSLGPVKRFSPYEAPQETRGPRVLETSGGPQRGCSGHPRTIPPPARRPLITVPRLGSPFEVSACRPLPQSSSLVPFRPWTEPMQPNERSLPLFPLVAALVLFNRVPNICLEISNSWERPCLHVVSMLTSFHELAKTACVSSAPFSDANNHGSGLC